MIFSYWANFHFSVFTIMRHVIVTLFTFFTLISPYANFSLLEKKRHEIHYIAAKYKFSNRDNVAADSNITFPKMVPSRSFEAVTPLVKLG